MSYLGEELKSQIDRKKISGKELAKRTGKSQSQMSRWCSGNQEFIDKKDLAIIATNLSSNAKEQAALIGAAAKDLVNIPGLAVASRMISIHIGDAPVRLESLDVQVPASRRTTYNVLARAEALHPDLRAILDHLAEIFKDA